MLQDVWLSVGRHRSAGCERCRSCTRRGARWASRSSSASRSAWRTCSACWRSCARRARPPRRTRPAARRPGPGPPREGCVHVVCPPGAGGQPAARPLADRCMTRCARYARCKSERRRVGRGRGSRRMVSCACGARPGQAAWARRAHVAGCKGVGAAVIPHMPPGSSLRRCSILWVCCTCVSGLCSLTSGRQSVHGMQPACTRRWFRGRHW